MTAARAGRGRASPRTAAAWAFAVAALGAGVVLARTATSAGAFMWVDQLAGGPAGTLDAVGAALPFGYAFTAGMLSAINPCGVALLPAYLGLYLSALDSAASPAARLRRALTVAGTMSGAFVVTFGAAGVVVAAIGSSLGSALPFAGLLVGVGLVGAGAYLLSGRTVYTSIGDRAAARLSKAVGAGGHRGYAAYGLAYAAASLGCTLPIFLAVVGLTTAAPDPARSAGQFALYGLGMGFVVTGLTAAIALFKGALTMRVRWFGSVLLDAVSGGILVLTGVYITAYWLALGF
jgi:cytochrome c biogenesis protein CcdA